MSQIGSPLLIAALAMDGDGGAQELSLDALPAGMPEGRPVWMHLDATHPEARTWLLETLELDEGIVDALLAEETRPRTLAMSGGTLLVLRGVNLNPGAEPEDMVSIRLWSDGTRVITTRLRRLRAVETLQATLRAGAGPTDAGGLVAALAEGLVDNMQAFTNSLSERLDELEEQVLTEESRELLLNLSALRRQSVILRRYLAPQREAVQRLHGEAVPWIGPDARARLLETADALTRHVEDLDATQDRAGILQEALTNRLSERMEQRMYALSLIATIFLPLTFVTGLLGINVAGIPGAEYPLAFWVVVGLLAVVSGVLLWMLWRRRWF